MHLNERIERWLNELKSTFNPAPSHQTQTRRPFVTLCYAQSLDGSLTTASGVGLALSSDASLRLTHQLRTLHDGILVGIGTVLADDPLLNVRHWSGPDPQPVVLDSQSRFPVRARLNTLSSKRCWVLTTAATETRTDKGPEFLTLPADANGRVQLNAALELLWQRGIKSLMVEGGGIVLTSFLQARLADAVVITIAPTLVGGYRAVGDLGLHSKKELPQIAPMHTERNGEDIIVWGTLQFSGTTP